MHKNLLRSDNSIPQGQVVPTNFSNVTVRDKKIIVIDL